MDKPPNRLIMGRQQYKPVYNQFTEVRELKQDWVKPFSVLTQSPLGAHLHELLEKRQHPLTDTALAYIRELEGSMQEKEKLISGTLQLLHEQRIQLEELEEKYMKVSSENCNLRKKAYHPANKRK